MPMTFTSYRPAFATADEREAFFDRVGRSLRSGHPIRYGAAMEHVLATNLGIMGGEGTLARDASEMLVLELDGWADQNGERRLEVPAVVLAQSEPFREAFLACRASNVREIEHFVKTQREEALPTEQDVSRFLNEDFVKELYFRLCPIADEYRNLAQHHRARVARLVGRELRLGG
jgi:hypothetical protein